MKSLVILKPDSPLGHLCLERDIIADDYIKSPIDGPYPAILCSEIDAQSDQYVYLKHASLTGKEGRLLSRREDILAIVDENDLQSVSPSIVLSEEFSPMYN